MDSFQIQSVKCNKLLSFINLQFYRNNGTTIALMLRGYFKFEKSAKMEVK